MEIKCNSCGGKLLYDIASEKLICVSCGNKISFDEVSNSEETKDYSNSNSNQSYAVKICKCSSCGATLNYSSRDEITSVCAFCGNTSVNFDRVGESPSPEYIIPFQISRERAAELVKNEISVSYFAPRKFKKFNKDQLVGVYVPYWLYDMYFYEEINMVSSVYEVYTHRTKTTEYFRAAEIEYSKMTFDASSKLSDDSSRKLEPFNEAGLKPFSPLYLTGFYADRYDVSKEEMNTKAELRGYKLLENSIFDSVPGFDKRLRNEKGIRSVLGTSYALLPVWFLTLNNNGSDYTFMVNGQTGKVVGTAPTDKKRVISISAILYAVVGSVTAAICGLIGYAAKMSDSHTDLSVFALLVILGILFVIIAKKNIEKYKMSLKLTELMENYDYSDERQV